MLTPSFNLWLCCFFPFYFYFLWNLPKFNNIVHKILIYILLYLAKCFLQFVCCKYYLIILFLIIFLNFLIIYYILSTVWKSGIFIAYPVQSWGLGKVWLVWEPLVGWMLMQREQTSILPSFPIPLRYRNLYFILWKIGSLWNVLSRLYSVCLMENRWQSRESGHSKICLETFQVTLPSSNSCCTSLEYNVLVEGEQDLYGMSFVDTANRILMN